jgi:prepilin-type N-terminal cleavage/methylation domain-containing protein
MSRPFRSSGFTLVEMLVVLVLIAISVALVYPSLLHLRDKFDDKIELATNERSRKKESFTRFISDGLPLKKYSSASKK